MSVASAVARAKERRPGEYCPHPRCLWHTGGGYCPRHAPFPDEFVRALERESAEEWTAEEAQTIAEDAARAERDT